MPKNFFNKTKILDGGMGQTLLARGMPAKGSLWSASALVDSQFHQLILDTHLDFIDAGANVIITTTFTTRRMRLMENNIINQFEALNIKAGKIAMHAKQKRPHIMVAGGLPPQNLTYEADSRLKHKITKDFYSQAKLLDPYVDFFYLDVLSSIKEFECAIAAIESLNKPFLLGAHISEGRCLPSGERLSELKSLVTHQNTIGVILACVSPEVGLKNLTELKSLQVPFGVKLNAFKTTSPDNGYNNQLKNCCPGNPNEILGKRQDLDPSTMARYIQKFQDAGATILGGCCETTPEHIKAITNLIIKKDHQKETILK
ncbi:homocysteine S-methyltransferase [bacterium]|nr:homocysteine S-methyltransferase [bacterium]